MKSWLSEYKIRDDFFHSIVTGDETWGGSLHFLNQKAVLTKASQQFTFGQKRHDIFDWNYSFEFFVWSELVWCHCDCLLVSGLKWTTYVSSPVTIEWKKSSLSSYRYKISLLLKYQKLCTWWYIFLWTLFTTAFEFFVILTWF